MNKFNTLYNQIILEFNQMKHLVKEDINADFSNKVSELFKKVLSDEACDLAELIFKNEAEKTAYIENAVKEYLDAIEEHITGDTEIETFMMLADDVKLEKVKAAIADNSETIFGKNIFN